MKGNLIIVESPTKAKEITPFLKQEGEFKVVSSKGHIRDLNEKKLSVDVDHGFAPQYEIPAEKKKLVEELTEQAAKAQTVYLAADPDREGEAIAWHLAVTLGLDPARTKRITYQEITKDAILNALKNPRDIDMNLVNAQQARRVLDRLIGFELSPVLWKKINRGLSAGRVQSVALRLVVDREREIMSFTPEAFYRISASFGTGDASFKSALELHFQGIDQARKFLEDCAGASFRVKSVEQKDAVRYPAAPFTTSTLQQEAARKLHFSVSQTMRVAQALYERGLITYMRTDSTNLSALAIGTAKKYITENYGARYSRPHNYATKSKGAQEAHEAIRPTFIQNERQLKLSAQEQALYDLIWRRTVASQMSPAQLINTDVTIECSSRSEEFHTEASQIVFDGFLKVYLEGTDDENPQEDFGLVPNLTAGTALSLLEMNADCKYTRAPLRYSEQSLVRKLEELGIGRPSTYATIISTLTGSRGYVIKGNKEGRKEKVTNLTLKNGVIKSSEKTEIVGEDKGKLLPQDTGMIVCDYLVENFPEILDYNHTAAVEEKLDEIAEGKLNWTEYLSKSYPPFHATVEQKLHDGQYSRISREIGIDPADGLPIVAKYGQYGPYVQKGEGENRRYASLAKGQLIETVSLEDAIKLLSLPRTVGEYEGKEIVANKGKFGPYIRYDGKFISLPKGVNPSSVSLEESIRLITESAGEKAQSNIIREWPEADVTIMNGRFGPYIKSGGANYKIPRKAKAEKLGLDECRAIIEAGKNSKKK